MSSKNALLERFFPRLSPSSKSCYLATLEMLYQTTNSGRFHQHFLQIFFCTGNFQRFDFPGFRTFSGLSDFETSPVYLPWFRMSKTYQKCYQKTEIYRIYQKFRYIFDIFVITENNGIILKMHLLIKKFWMDVGYIIPKHTKYIHAKNTLKTVLGRSGAEINDFLCFGPFLVRFRFNLGLNQRFSTDGSRPGNGSWEILNGSWKILNGSWA